MNSISKTTLGSLIEFQRGYDLPKSEMVEGIYPVRSSNGILGYHNEYKTEGPGITIGRSGTVGIPHLIKTNFYPHNTSLFIKDFKGNDVNYIFYLLKNLKLGDRGSGSGVPTMNRNHLHPLDILAHLNLSTQKQIAKILSDLDAKIEVNNKINQKLEAMAKSLYDYWFVQFDFPDANGKPYKSSGGKMVFNEALKREIPEGWEDLPLGECINIYDSLRVPLARSEREKIKGSIPYYGATSIMGYVNDFLFNDEYILLAEDGSVMDDKGMPIVQFIWGKTWVNNHAHVIQATNKSHNEFIYQLVKMIPVVLIKTGSIQMKINQQNLKKHRVLIPSVELIEKYSKKANSIRKQLINNIEQNQKLSELRDWLLPMLMNGQVTVGDVEQELGMVAEESFRK